MAKFQKYSKVSILAIGKPFLFLFSIFTRIMASMLEPYPPGSGWRCG
jgi:arginine/lysine/ornithine decarboxylase